MAVKEGVSIDYRIEELQRRLYGVYGNSGLAAALDYAAEKSGETSPEYKKLKAEFDTKQAELNKLKEQAKKEFDTKKAAKNKEKEDKIAAEQKKKEEQSIKVTQDELDRARRRNDTATVKAKEDELKALKAPKDAMGEPIVTEAEEDGGIYADYTVDAKGNVTNKEGKTVVFVESKNEQGDILPKEYTSSASARDAFLKNYSQPGQLNQLKKDLVASGYLKDSEKNSPNWIGAVDDLIIAHTRKSVVDVKYGGLKQPVTIDLFMKEKKAGAGTGGGTKTYREYSSRGDASRMLDGYFNDLLGYGATPEEEDAFYKELRAAEDKAFRTVTDGRTGVGGFLEDADRLLIAAKVAKKALKNTDVDMLLNSRQGSQVAIDIADLQAKADAYGIDMPASEALKYVVAGVGQKDYIAKQEQRLRQLSMTMHPYLKDHIAAGGTVKEVADEYARTKSNKLGIVVTNATKDKDIMSAVASGKSVVDFERELQMDPLWRKTPEARKVANDFANTMIQTFGLG
jgi:hypothetical protein